MSQEEYIIYGWKESNPEIVIDEEWILDRKINIFLTKNYHNRSVPLYGIKWDLNEENNYEIRNEMFDVVKNVYNEITVFFDKYNLDVPFLGMHLGHEFNKNNNFYVYTPI
jgi:hypothetical protein